MSSIPSIGQGSGQVPVSPKPDGGDGKVAQAAQGRFCEGALDLCKSRKFQAIVITSALLLVIFLASNPVGWLATAIGVGVVALKIILSLVVIAANMVIYKLREEKSDSSSSSVNSPWASPPLSSVGSWEEREFDFDKPTQVRNEMPPAPVRKSSWLADHPPVIRTIYQPAEKVILVDVSPDLRGLKPPQRKDGKGGWSSRASVAHRAVR